MGFDYLKTIHGCISILQILLGFAALFATSFVWSGGNVYFLFFMSSVPGQIYVLFALFVTWIIVLGITTLEILGQDVIERLVKLKLIIVHAVQLVLMLIAAAVESHYLSAVAGNDSYYARLVVVTIFSWILVVSYLAQGVLVFIS